MIEQIRLASKDEDDEEIETTKVIGNEMFFYGDVSNESILEFIEKFKKLEAWLLRIAATSWVRTEHSRAHM